MGRDIKPYIKLLTKERLQSHERRDVMGQSDYATPCAWHDLTA
jgi:hypothetical protein